MKAVAGEAGVDRVTVHRHFATREKLLYAVTDSLVSEIGVDVAALPADASLDARIQHMVEHFMHEPERARAWLAQFVTGGEHNAGGELVAREVGLIRMLASSPLGKPGIDPEVLAVILLGGTLLYSVHAHDNDNRSPRAATRKFVREVKRLLLHGAAKRGAFSDPTGTP